MDISSARESTTGDLASFITPDAAGLADPADAGTASLSGDAISTSPLTFFGGVVTQIGQAMVNDAIAPGPADPGASPNGTSGSLDQAIGLLEGILGLMSAYGDDPSAAASEMARLASSQPPSGFS
jgi:hypothetical protein